jgi:hypothetical protein
MGMGRLKIPFPKRFAENKKLGGEKKKMNTKDGKKYTGIILAAIIVSAVFAMAMPAIVRAGPVGGGSVGANTTYTGTVASDTARGGNITTVDFSGITSQTSKWQGYLGTVSGSIVLASSGGDKMYEWTWLTGKGGEVFATRNNPMTYTDWTTLAARTGPQIDTDFGFDSTVSDNATILFNQTASAINVSGTTITGGASMAAKTFNNAGALTWVTNAYSIGGSTTMNDYVFAGMISNGGTAYDGNTVDYQMIVPVETVANPTYYFYVELA